MKEMHLSEKRLKDGSLLGLKVYKDSAEHYQLNLVCGPFTFQFPTTEELAEGVVRDMYRSVRSRGDFQRILGAQETLVLL